MNEKEEMKNELLNADMNQVIRRLVIIEDTMKSIIKEIARIRVILYYLKYKEKTLEEEEV
jgi:hypothetical protein